MAHQFKALVFHKERVRVTQQVNLKTKIICEFESNLLSL